jgi:signal transduction histidine kinase
MQRDLKRLIDTRAQALSAVSHDLRLPITRMRLRLEALGNSALRDKMAQDLGEMDTMIGDTLDFLRASTNVEASALLNLDALLDSVCEDMEALGARIHRSGQARRAIAARPHALRRCIANLLENARCYGGDAVSLAVEDSGSAVRIIIEDQGPGIPAAEREKVFEPYYRLESSRARHTGGTGLGLTIAKAIVEAHHGTITLGTAAGGGLRVELALPQAATNTV